MTAQLAHRQHHQRQRVPVRAGRLTVLQGKTGLGPGDGSIDGHIGQFGQVTEVFLER